MADKFACNYSLASPITSHSFSAIWKLTRVMKAAGWNVMAHSDGTTKVAAGNNANDSWGNNVDPMLDVYNSAFDAPTMWIVLRGPSTLKMMMTTAPGSFVRGEQVSQATTGATGEVLGVVWDSTLAVGWAIIQPRTGTFNGSNIITGSISSATMTPTVKKEFVREVMFNKQSASVVNGTIFYICADVAAESAQLYSTIATSAGCTQTIGPAMSGTGNTFPALGMCIRGTGGTFSNVAWFSTVTSGMTGLANLICTNAIPSSGVSADGSFYAMLGHTNSADAMTVFGFGRVDNQEPGDVDPYVWYCDSNQPWTSATLRVGPVTSGTTTTSFSVLTGQSSVYFRGYTARDGYVSSRDIVVGFYAAFSNISSSQNVGVMRGGSNPLVTQNIPANTPPIVRDTLGLYSGDATYNIRMFKGIPRWIGISSSGSRKSTYDNLKWICFAPTSGTTSGEPAVMIGPWDGVTIPL